ncbi:MAG: GDSL-type esterase/lipase family protein [Tannerellaceae bacterium]|nr:GDSL-type esterase/lipase family protein [Tannerellaceae bacterium]
MMKQRKWLMNSLGAIAIVLLGIYSKSPVYPSDRITGMKQDTLPFLRPELVMPEVSRMAFVDSFCYITDPQHTLASFFACLDSLYAGKNTVIQVVHLGDSHIQAGHYSGRVMRLLHQQFGNAGRGWIAPFKLSRSNEPDDYFISSVIRDWTAGRCIQSQPKCPFGLGGIGIQSASPSINFDICIAPTNGAGYAFNQAVLYRDPRSMPMLPVGISKDPVKTFPAPETVVLGVVADTFRIAHLTDSLQLQSTRRKQGTDTLLPPATFSNLYYGFSLTNGNPGILYHSIGVNGAMFVNYTDESYVRQLAVLKPTLLIISLGTNETFGRRFTAGEFTGQIDAFIALVKKYMPETTLLLTTPPECYKRTYVNKKRVFVRNENTERAAKAIAAYATENGIACWDLFTATGGKNSNVKWHAAKLMGADRIHFNKDGYYEQGTLLYRALIKTYNLQSIKEEPLTPGLRVAAHDETDN